MLTYGDATKTVHDADGGDLGGLPLGRGDLVVVLVITRKERLRDGADVVDIYALT